MEVVSFDEVASTNDECLKLALGGAASGTAVTARRQTNGRGRLGRSWLSLDGDNIHVSVLHRTRRPPGAMSGLTLDVGSAVHGVLLAAGVAPRLKWPNDILIHGAKVAGILCELHDDGAGGHFVVIGVGINVEGTRLPAELKTATTLALELGHAVGVAAPGVAALEGQVVFAVREAARRYEVRGRPDVESWKGRSDDVGKRVRSVADGRVATVVGIASDGALLLIWDGRQSAEPFLAGELEQVL